VLRAVSKFGFVPQPELSNCGSPLGTFAARGDDGAVAAFV
jgi:hypothetical protein